MGRKLVEEEDGMNLKKKKNCLCCWAKTRFSSSLVVSASHIFKNGNTQEFTWGTACSVREGERERWQQKRAGVGWTEDERSECEAQEPLCCRRPAGAAWHLPSEWKTLVREQWGGIRRTSFTLMRKISHQPLARRHLKARQEKALRLKRSHASERLRTVATFDVAVNSSTVVQLWCSWSSSESIYMICEKWKNDNEMSGSLYEPSSGEMSSKTTCYLYWAVSLQY